MYRYNIGKKKDYNFSFILDCKQADVTGDGIIDRVFLIGNRPFSSKSPFFSNIQLLIQDGKNNNLNRLNLEENAGYSPSIFLGDFTGNRVNDILVSIDSGGSGEMAFYYIYSYLHNKYNKIFDHNQFNDKYQNDVRYIDNYQVNVFTPIRKYTVDIRYKGEEYLNDLYNNGILKKTLNGWVNPLGGLYPIDFKKNKIYELYTTQRIAGRYNADSLGYLQTSLSWNGTEFKPFYQTVGILG